MKRSTVAKYSTDSDKSFLGTVTTNNNSNNRNKSSKRKHALLPLYLNRQERSRLHRKIMILKLSEL